MCVLKLKDALEKDKQIDSFSAFSHLSSVGDGHVRFPLFPSTHLVGGRTFTLYWVSFSAPAIFQSSNHQLGSEVKVYSIFKMHHEREKAGHKATGRRGCFQSFQSPQRKLEQRRNRRKCHSTNELASQSCDDDFPFAFLSAMIARAIQIDEHAKIGLL